MATVEVKATWCLIRDRVLVPVREDPDVPSPIGQLFNFETPQRSVSSPAGLAAYSPETGIFTVPVSGNYKLRIDLLRGSYTSVVNELDTGNSGYLHFAAGAATQGVILSASLYRDGNSQPVPAEVTVFLEAGQEFKWFLFYTIGVTDLQEQMVARGDEISFLVRQPNYPYRPVCNFSYELIPPYETPQNPPAVVLLVTPVSAPNGTPAVITASGYSTTSVVVRYDIFRNGVLLQSGPSNVVEDIPDNDSFTYYSCVCYDLDGLVSNEDIKGADRFAVVGPQIFNSVGFSIGHAEVIFRGAAVIPYRITTFNSDGRTLSSFISSPTLLAPTTYLGTAGAVVDFEGVRAGYAGATFDIDGSALIIAAGASAPLAPGVFVSLGVGRVDAVGATAQNVAATSYVAVGAAVTSFASLRITASSSTFSGQGLNTSLFQSAPVFSSRFTVGGSAQTTYVGLAASVLPITGLITGTATVEFEGVRAGIAGSAFNCAGSSQVTGIISYAPYGLGVALIDGKSTTQFVEDSQQQIYASYFESAGAAVVDYRITPLLLLPSSFSVSGTAGVEFVGQQYLQHRSTTFSSSAVAVAGFMGLQQTPNPRQFTIAGSSVVGGVGAEIQTYTQTTIIGTAAAAFSGTIDLNSRLATFNIGGGSSFATVSGTITPFQFSAAGQGVVSWQSEATLAYAPARFNSAGAGSFDGRGAQLLIQARAFSSECGAVTEFSAQPQGVVAATFSVEGAAFVIGVLAIFPVYPAVGIVSAGSALAGAGQAVTSVTFGIDGVASSTWTGAATQNYISGIADIAGNSVVSIFGGYSVATVFSSAGQAVAQAVGEQAATANAKAQVAGLAAAVAVGGAVAQAAANIAVTAQGSFAALAVRTVAVSFESIANGVVNYSGVALTTRALTCQGGAVFSAIGIAEKNAYVAVASVSAAAAAQISSAKILTAEFVAAGGAALAGAGGQTTPAVFQSSGAAVNSFNLIDASRIVFNISGQTSVSAVGGATVSAVFSATGAGSIVFKTNDDFMSGGHVRGYTALFARPAELEAEQRLRRPLRKKRGSVVMVPSVDSESIYILPR